MEPGQEKGEGLEPRSDVILASEGLAALASQSMEVGKALFKHAIDSDRQLEVVTKQVNEVQTAYEGLEKRMDDLGNSVTCLQKAQYEGSVDDIIMKKLSTLEANAKSNAEMFADIKALLQQRAEARSSPDQEDVARIEIPIQHHALPSEEFEQSEELIAKSIHDTSQTSEGVTKNMITQFAEGQEACCEQFLQKYREKAPQMIAGLLENKPALLSLFKPVLVYLIATGQMEIVYKIRDLITAEPLKNKLTKKIEGLTLMFEMVQRVGTQRIISLSETNPISKQQRRHD